MNKAVLTEKEFWFNYWENKRADILQLKPKNSVLHHLLDDVIKKESIKSAIELGGFPGEFSIYLHQKHEIKSTILDYYINRPLFLDLLTLNGIKDEDAVGLEEFDLLSDQKVMTKYDLVYSFGLIEHFGDTKAIISKHIDFLNDDGFLLIEIPNFRGVNGWIQKTFDRPNYNVHNIDCMDPKFLEKVAKELGLKNVRAYFTGGFEIWLENKNKRNLGVKIVFTTVKLLGKVITKVFKFESRFTSPYIVLKANN